MAFVDFQNGCTFTALSATPARFTLLGGRYAFGAAATWGGGSVELDILMPDGSTLLNTMAAALSVNGLAVMDLPPGTYQITIATATAVTGFVVRIPYQST